MLRVVINSNQMIAVTTSQQKMGKEIKAIHEVLIKFGFPHLINKNLPREEKDIEDALSEYFQPTPKRENLVEWLILQNYPLYQQELDRNEKKANKKRKLLAYLWKLGVMPFSKHTRNLDYEKYLEGLIGYENSINLIYNLCMLLLESNKLSRSREDKQFHSFLEDLYRNYDSLVNLEYDPYKISFPPAYQQLTEDAFNEKYEGLLEKIKDMREKGKVEETASKTSFEMIFREFEEHKSQFHKTYSLLASKMKKVVSDNQNLVQNWRKQENSQLKNRTIAMTSTLPKLYRQYKDKSRCISFPSSSLGSEKQQILNLITSLNEKVQL